MSPRSTGQRRPFPDADAAGRASQTSAHAGEDLQRPERIYNWRIALEDGNDGLVTSCAPEQAMRGRGADTVSISATATTNARGVRRQRASRPRGGSACDGGPWGGRQSWAAAAHGAGDGVVLVDDGHDVHLEERVDGEDEVALEVFVAEVATRHEELRAVTQPCGPIGLRHDTCRGAGIDPAQRRGGGRRLRRIAECPVTSATTAATTRPLRLRAVWVRTTSAVPACRSDSDSMASLDQISRALRSRSSRIALAHSCGTWLCGARQADAVWHITV